MHLGGSTPCVARLPSISAKFMTLQRTERLDPAGVSPAWRTDASPELARPCRVQMFTVSIFDGLSRRRS